MRDSTVHGERNKNPSDAIQSRNKGGFYIIGFGLIATFFAVLSATTPLLLTVSDLNTAQLVSGIFGGIGVISLIYGMLYSVPDKSIVEERIGFLGVGLAGFGVLWFFIQFPHNWDMYHLTTMAVVGLTYSVGIFLLMGITFHAVVNYRMKSTEQFTITHRFESDNTNETTHQPQQDQDSNKPKKPSSGGIGLIGRLSSESRETYGPRKPMTREDRQRHSIGNSQSKSNNKKNDK